ncbi:MAG: FAD-dependent monooxygenase [Pseudonocardiales bacterium]|nr:FAD-dependent monooxygenase [Pseudonocardiales bacterium]
MPPPGQSTGVVVVGAGPTGLTTALLLAHYGVACTVVERRSEPSRTPRARAVTLRTMEVLRTLGLAEEVSAAAVASERIGLPFTFAPTLAEATPARTTTMVRRGVRAEQSPCTTVMCPQDVLERILLARIAATRFIRLRRGVAVRDVAVRGEDVLVHTAEGSSLLARYVVGADGAASPVRRSCSPPAGLSKQSGAPAEPAVANTLVLFEADLTELVADCGATIYFLDHEGVRGYLQPTAQPHRWTFNQVHSDAATGTRADPAATVRAVLGADVAVRVVETTEWAMRSVVAPWFRRGPVFLAGDAAHVVSPFSGSGMNLGIQDAANLAWKLAAVLHGRARPGLLASYEEERRPVAVWNVEEDRRNVSIIRDDPGWRRWSVELPRRRRKDGLLLGYRYRSAAVLPEGGVRGGEPEGELAAPPMDYTQYVPSARPGDRAPHCWLDDHQTSTVDLHRDGFAVVGPDPMWATHAAAAAGALTLPLAALPPATSAAARARLAELYRLSAGAVLVRPDGHVGWRCTEVPADPAGALASAICTILDAVG